ncbi:flavoprotein [Actinokineospora sp. G85]|uniref:flavoprotein n=1 Tax=Actinokineospora sp. G85 TaxID=3406626 RepID=UPI003C730A72
MTDRVLGLVAAACGGGETRFRAELAEPAAALGWRLAITATPTFGRWLEATGEVERLRALTDLPVRHDSRLPTEPKPYPRPDAFVFAPASANSVAKLATGIADSQALTHLNQALGSPGVPLVVGTLVSGESAAHPLWPTHLATLRAAGATVVDLLAVDRWTSLLDLIGDP